MIEIVQGEGGVLPLDKTYLEAIQTICDDNDILLIIDEVQTGIGRCGTLFAYEQFDIQPDIVTLANNHILDFGPEGITDSIAALNEAGIKYVGAGEDLEEAKKLEIMEVGGRKIGFLGTSRVYMATSWAAGENHPGVFSTYDPSLPIEEIKKADELVDYLVVYVHWGVERETTPKEYQRVMGKQYMDAGADIVIGSHPHVLQPLEFYNEKPIMFSMGNFVFGSSIPSTELLKIEIHADDSMTVTEIPCTSSGGFTRLK